MLGLFPVLEMLRQVDGTEGVIDPGFADILVLKAIFGGCRFLINNVIQISRVGMLTGLERFDQQGDIFLVSQVAIG